MVFLDDEFVGQYAEEKDVRCFCTFAQMMNGSGCPYCNQDFFMEQFGIEVWPSFYDKDTEKTFFNDSHLTLTKDGEKYHISYNYRNNLVVGGKMTGKEGYTLTMFDKDHNQVFSDSRHKHISWQERVMCIAFNYFEESI